MVLNTEQLFREALGLHQAGMLEDAEAVYRNVLAIQPEHSDSLNLLGVLALQTGRAEAAIDLIRKAIELNDGIADFHANIGEALRAAGRLHDAAVHYERAIAIDSHYFEAYNNLGNVLRAQGKLDEAAGRYKQALALKPESAEIRQNLADVLREQGNLDEAVEHYRRVLALKPDFPEAHNNLGITFARAGNLQEAVSCFRHALSLRPTYVEAQNNLGNALRETDNLHEAEAVLRRALTAKPDDVDAHVNLGVALMEQGKLDEAAARFERALALNPDSVLAHCNLGVTLQQQGNLAKAISHVRQASVLDPNLSLAHNNLGLMLRARGNIDEARAHHERALALDPSDLSAQLGLCMAQLPLLYMEEGEIAVRRRAYEEHLRCLCDNVRSSKSARSLADAIGTSQPFFLAYQGHDDRDLQRLYGSLICRSMAERYSPALLARQPGPSEPIRVGIVSGFFRHHSVWKIPIKGWLTQLDRRQFQIFGYHTGVRADSATEMAAGCCDRFIQGPLSIDGWRAEILGDAPHVLIYPEVGMDPVAVTLAAQRLAAVQCSSWGHPQTSGLPTMDYYLSSDLMEPPDGQEHYTEQLIRLPNLGIYYEPLDVLPVSLKRAELGLRASATAYWCCQSLFKYLPQYDQVFPRIAREVEDCQFVFLELAPNPHATAQFRKRIANTFASVGLSADHYCVFLPPLSQDRFVAASGLCDVYLDSIGWSGGNSTLESLPHDIPIVTLSGSLMRGRHSTAILQMMGVTEGATVTIDAYAAAAVRLARDVAYRMNVKQSISENKQKIFRDRSCILALEDFLREAVRARYQMLELRRPEQRFPGLPR